jgi:hypothetical protein
MLHAAEVLCWVLEHRDSGFGAYLARLEGELRAHRVAELLEGRV